MANSFSSTSFIASPNGGALLPPRVKDHTCGGRKPGMPPLKFGTPDGKGLWRFIPRDVEDFIREQRNEDQESHSAFALRLLRQLDPVVVLLITLVFLGKNLFEPMRLAVSDRLIHNRGRLTDDEIFATRFAP